MTWRTRIIRTCYLGTFAMLGYAFVTSGCLGWPIPQGEIIGMCVASALWVYVAWANRRSTEIWKRLAQNYGSKLTKHPLYPVITLPKKDVESGDS